MLQPACPKRNLKGLALTGQTALDPHPPVPDLRTAGEKDVDGQQPATSAASPAGRKGGKGERGDP
jgi:hypothetical protein